MMYRSIVLVLAALQLPSATELLAQRATSADTLRLSLEEAVATGLRVADEVRLSSALSEITEAQYDAARSSLMPQLRLTSTYSHVYESARATAVNQLFNQPNTYSASANFSQTLFQGGRLIAAARAASSLAEASRLDVHEQRALFTVQVQRAYLGALLAERFVQLQESNLQLASARLTQVKQFQAAGQAAAYDVLRAKVERSNIEPLTIQVRNDRDLAYLELKRLLNLPLDQPVVLTTTIDPNAAQTLVAAYLDSAAAPNRASLRSAELVARSRRFGISAAKADLLPTVTALFQTGYQAFPPPGFGLPSQRGGLDFESCPTGTATNRVCQNGGWFEDRNLAIQFSWPVFDGFRVKSAIELARAQAQVADLQLQQEREQVAVEVAKARAELQRAKAVFDARKETSSEANEAFRLASLRFSRGLSTQLEVSDAQLALLTAESGEARATFDLFLAGAEMARALGRPIPLPPTRTPTRRSEN